MTWGPFGRIAAAAESIAAYLNKSDEQAQSADKWMSTVAENQRRMVEQGDEGAARAAEHRNSCDKYHKDIMAQLTESANAWQATLSALESRVAELEKKTEEPWK